MNYLVFDLETTGISILADEPVSITVYDPKGNKYHHWFVNTSVPISPEAFAVHGISKKFLTEKGYIPKVVTGAYSATIWDHYPATLLGYNVTSFDFPMLQNFLARHHPGSFKHPPVLQVIDVMHLVSQRFKTRKWLKQSEAAQRLGLGVDESKLHDSRYDTLLCWQIYEKCSIIERTSEGEKL